MTDRVEAYREMAARFVNHACGGANGRDEFDAVYQDVTEGRDVADRRRSYSSCGDLVHWMLFRIGVRESWVNRAESHLAWRIGRNISNLCWSPCPSRNPLPGERFSAGDALIIYNRDDGTDAHALVVLEHSNGVILSADYGQPGGALRTRALLQPNMLGGRKMRHVLTLPMALTGSLAPPDWTYLEQLATGEELDAWAAAIGFPLPSLPPEAA